ncbi:MAG: cupin domain-containing protein [Candidatus Binatia bacterium]
MRTFFALLVFGLVLVSGSPALGDTAHGLLGPDEIQWSDGPPSLPKGSRFAVIEGKPSEAGPFTMRLRFPAGYRVPPHTHPAIEHVTVLSGLLSLGMGERFDAGKMKPMAAGSFILMPIGMTHFVEAKEDTILQLHGIGPWDVKYVNPEDDPRTKK